MPKTAIGNARRCRQDLIGREGYTKGATEQCPKTPIDDTRRCRQRVDGPVTSRYAGTDRDENCWKTSTDNTRSRWQDLIGREGYTKGATEQCRKTSIDNTRRSRQQGKGSVTSRHARRTVTNNARKCPYTLHCLDDTLLLVKRAIQKGWPNNAGKRP